MALALAACGGGGGGGSSGGGIIVTARTVDFDYADSNQAVQIDLAAHGLGDVSIRNVSGSDHDDSITGNNQDNMISGGVGSDSLDGGEGNDDLDGGTGSDDLDGGKGDDNLDGGAGADNIDGGDGKDVASYNNSNDGVFVDLPSGSAAGGHAEGDRLSNIEGISGSDFFDVLIGNDDDNIIWGNGGDDYIKGCAGDDYLSGGEGDDYLIGDEGKDTIDGGTGIDTAVYVESDAGVTINLAAGTAEGGHAEGDTLINIENIVGSSFNDILIGDNNENEIWGDGGHDVIHGGAGDDILLGGAGNDWLTGGDGKDQFLLFRTNWESTDTVTDFSTDDQIAVAGNGSTLAQFDLKISDNNGNAEIHWDSDRDGSFETLLFVLENFDATTWDDSIHLLVV